MIFKEFVSNYIVDKLSLFSYDFTESICVGHNCCKLGLRERLTEEHDVIEVGHGVGIAVEVALAKEAVAACVRSGDWNGAGSWRRRVHIHIASSAAH